ncbi:MAG: agmatine deiminase family protein [Phycisphaerae bacterium]|nr:agmatine deiminase family protein [Phycisphaerae bacterium]
MSSSTAGRPIGKSSRYRMPAEWEPHEATWIGWPHNRSDWPGKLSAIHWVYAEIVRKIAPGEIVRILVNSREHERLATRYLSRAGVDPGRVEFFRFPTDRGWTRDFGPIFVRRGGARGRSSAAIVDFRFNAWARYPEWRKDDRIASKAAKALGVPLVEPIVGGERLVLEGGAIDVNGAGTLMTTEECLLDREVQPRNPHLSRSQVEEALGRYLGAESVLWLGGGVTGDDTHGHVDDVCRFVDERTVVLCQEPNAEDVNHAPLRENRERLASARLAGGGKVEVVPLPMPGPLLIDGYRLPASYANFYISNAAVIVPTFNDPNDRVALGILGDLFPTRQVVGIHAVDLVLGFGTLHCLTQQQPVV